MRLVYHRAAQQYEFEIKTTRRASLVLEKKTTKTPYKMTHESHHSQMWWLNAAVQNDVQLINTIS